MQRTREEDGKVYTTEDTDTFDLEPGDRIFSYPTDSIKTVKEVEYSDGNLGECSDPECCSQIIYYDIYYSDGSADLVVSATYPFEKIIAEVDSGN